MAYRIPMCCSGCRLACVERWGWGIWGTKAFAIEWTRGTQGSHDFFYQVHVSRENAIHRLLRTAIRDYEKMRYVVEKHTFGSVRP